MGVWKHTPIFASLINNLKFKKMTELKQEMLANTATIRENSTRGEDIVKIALDKIVVRDGLIK